MRFKTIAIWIIFTLLLVVVVVFTRYRYSYITHLTDDDLAWIRGKERDSVWFGSNYGNTSYLFSETDLYERKSKFFFRESNEEYKDTLESYGWYSFSVYPVNCIDSIRNINDDMLAEIREKDYAPFEVLWGRFLVKRTEKDNQVFSSLFGMRTSKGYISANRCDSLQNILRPFIPYDPDYHNYIIFDDNNSDYSGNMSKEIKNKITTYVINKKYGLVYYKTEDGEEFTRIFN